MKSQSSIHALLAASSLAAITAFCPSLSLSSPASSSRAIRSSLAYLDSKEVLLDHHCSDHHHHHVSPLSASPASQSSPLIASLDAEMDTFASPNDRRYSASDWLHNMVNFRHSSILSQIRHPVGVITAWSVMVSVAYKWAVCMGYEGVAGRVCLGSTPHSFIASTIGLLLVFRTNSAYQKFRVSCCC
jgi:hypothetical protein